MISEERIRKQKELVQDMGMFYEKGGLQPVAARILSLLIIMDKEQYTFDEIVEELQISKSAASNSLHILEIRNFIETITKPGDRKRYFRFRKMDKFAIIDDHRNRLQKVADFLKKVLELKANQNSENSMHIKDLIDMLSFFLCKFEDLKKEFLTSQKV